MLSILSTNDHGVILWQVNLVIYNLPAARVLIQTIINMVVIGCVGDAVGAGAQGTGNSVLRSAMRMMVGN